MPWESGTYFTRSDVERDEKFLASQSLNDDQIEGVGAWHRARLGGQIAFWSATAFILGGVIGSVGAIYLW